MATVYQAANNDWIVFSNGVKTFFSLEEDARNMASKITFSEEAQVQAVAMSDLADKLSNIVSVYFDRGYDSGGVDPIVDGDIVSLNITAAELAAMITLSQEFSNFLNNAAVTTSNYNASLNNMRNDI